ncbi:helix-turn-helix domain-containing protein [Staphylococcus auricularis]
MLAEYLKEARESKDLTQEDVAQKLFVTRQTISRWEQGVTLPNVYVLEALSSIYDVPLEYLINGISEEKEDKKMNYFALFGSIVFNVLLFSIVILVALSSILIMWSLVVIFTLSPFVYLVTVFLQIQPFELFELLLSLGFFAIGIILIPVCYKVSRALFKYFKIYLKYNHKAIFTDYKDAPR